MMPKFVVSLAAVQLGEVSELVRIPLLKLGRWVKGTVKFAITRAEVAKLVENFRKRQNGEVVIDYEHASEMPGVAQGQPIPAAGWLREIEPEPDADGIVWGKADFTARAREMIGAGEYKYISPAIEFGARDKVSGEQQGATLTSVGLVNRPFFDMLPAVQLSEGWIPEEERKKMVKQVVLADRAKAQVRVVLDDGAESTLTVEGLAPEPRVIHLSDVKRTDDGRLDFESVTRGEDVLVAGEVFRAMQAERELQAAVEAGKITPAQRPHFERLALSDLAGFRELVKTMRQQVDLSEHGFAGSSGEGGDAQRIDQRIDAKVREKMDADKGLDYHRALKVVMDESPDLRQAKARAMRD